MMTKDDLQNMKKELKNLTLDPKRRLKLEDMIEIILCTHLTVLQQVSDGWYSYFKRKYDQTRNTFEKAIQDLHNQTKINKNPTKKKKRFLYNKEISKVIEDHANMCKVQVNPSYSTRSQKETKEESTQCTLTSRRNKKICCELNQMAYVNLDLKHKESHEEHKFNTNHWSSVLYESRNQMESINQDSRLLSSVGDPPPLMVTRAIGPNGDIQSSRDHKGNNNIANLRMTLEVERLNKNLAMMQQMNEQLQMKLTSRDQCKDKGVQCMIHLKKKSEQVGGDCPYAQDSPPKQCNNDMYKSIRRSRKTRSEFTKYRDTRSSLLRMNHSYERMNEMRRLHYSSFFSPMKTSEISKRLKMLLHSV
ncbi:unnamed protein product [Moneuplotes crassus]|uniref:Uncharacterized protein n=1 Tax=Euplotes crassus TaxID=5936 RepID=A0AAD1U5N0_EUPCR|nr:unnamed protein product [Moneuplotes crassus]